MISLFGRGLNPFAGPQVEPWPAKEMYCPHPATNWTLNPFFAPHGVRLHTREGFRAAGPYDSLLDWLPTAPRPLIYTYGQSSTYCTNLLYPGQAWPDKLAADPELAASVINGAVGGHSGLQSLSRLLAWGPLLRPDLVVVYTCKNDLTALKVSAPLETRVHPDWQNIVNTFGWALRRRFSLRTPSIDIAFRKPRMESPAHADGLLRFDDGCLQAVLGRYRLVAQLAEQWGGRVLFVSEVIRPSPYKALMDRINDAVPEAVRDLKNAHWFDVRPHLPQDNLHFEDKLHLTEQGCTVLAALIRDAIQSRNLLHGDRP